MTTWVVLRGSGALNDVVADKFHVESGVLVLSAWRQTPVPDNPGIFFSGGGYYEAIRAFAPGDWRDCFEADLKP